MRTTYIEYYFEVIVFQKLTFCQGHLKFKKYMQMKNNEFMKKHYKNRLTQQILVSFYSFFT